ncbi:hypothetical protein AVEN_117189-1 [Araneus ventricosus]|uniref:Uncharacterized protein n=1 Tax=Araneus ventricosus TaxID=182803 RepID=A0A4Y2AXG8_ARAVE|nr:hypothetical protein AVEN_117189-1 [Araneus ventricosus]
MQARWRYLSRRNCSKWVLQERVALVVTVNLPQVRLSVAAKIARCSRASRFRTPFEGNTNVGQFAQEFFREDNTSRDISVNSGIYVLQDCFDLQNVCPLL